MTNFTREKLNLLRFHCNYFTLEMYMNWLRDNNFLIKVC